jgi:hypothetical protein
VTQPTRKPPRKRTNQPTGGSRTRRRGAGAPRAEPGLVRDPALIRALRSPLRQEIVDVAQALGPCAVADLARELGRPADGLYYHVRALVAAGLLVPAGERGSGRQREALYATAAPESGLWLLYDPADPENAAAVTAAVGSMLRLTARNFTDAFRPDGEVCCEGPRRNLWAGRSTGWLAPEDLAEVNELLQRLRAVLERPRAAGKRLHAVTYVVAPVVPVGRMR